MVCQYSEYRTCLFPRMLVFSIKPFIEPLSQLPKHDSTPLLCWPPSVWCRHSPPCSTSVCCPHFPFPRRRLSGVLPSSPSFPRPPIPVQTPLHSTLHCISQSWLRRANLRGHGDCMMESLRGPDPRTSDIKATLAQSCWHINTNYTVSACKMSIEKICRTYERHFWKMFIRGGGTMALDIFFYCSDRGSYP